MARYLSLALALGWIALLFALLRAPGPSERVAAARPAGGPVAAPVEASGVAPVASSGAWAIAAGPAAQALPADAGRAALGERRGRGTRHRLRIVDEAGAPLGRAFVRGTYRLLGASAVAAEQSAGIGRHRLGTRRADADGGFELPLWSGAEVLGEGELELRLTASLGGVELEGRLVDARLAWREGVEFDSVVLRAPRGALHGSVATRCDQPVAGARVEVWWLQVEAEAAADGPPGRIADRVVLTGADGGFRVEGAPAAEHWVRARHPDWPVAAERRLGPEAVACPLVLQVSQGVRGRLALPVEVGDLELELVGRANGARRLDGDGGVAEARGRSGECFELPTKAGAVRLLAGDRFELSAVEVGAGQVRDLGTLDLTGWVPVELWANDAEGTVSRVQLRPALSGLSWLMELDQERRLVLPPEAFPVEVSGASGAVGFLEGDGPYVRRLQLEEPLMVELELGLPPELPADVESHQMLTVWVRPTDREPSAESRLFDRFAVMDSRVRLRLPAAGEYELTLEAWMLSMDPFDPRVRELDIEPLLLLEEEHLSVELGRLRMAEDGSVDLSELQLKVELPEEES